MLSLKTSLLGLLAATSVVYAQTPAYIGQLLIKPGISNTKCLTPATDADGAAVSIQDCTGAANQKWTFTGGQIRIFANKCLDVTGGVNADGTKLQVWTCVANSANQKFSYSFWDFRITWNNNGKCVDLAKGATANGTPAQIWTCGGFSINRIWNTGYLYNQIPAKTQNGQTGTSACGTGNSQTSQCQTAVINSATDFCLYGPPSPNSQIGDIERIAVAYCTKPGRGTRLIPNGTLRGVHFVKTPEYVQVTGAGDFTKINIRAGDSGGEMDPHGADGNGNPIGGLVYGNTFGQDVQYHEWTTFQSSNEFCFRACVGARAKALCQHIYDVMGCWWNMPANYDAGYFENCDGNPATPMGVYGTSTWFQGVSPTPAAHPAPASSNCVRVPSVTSTPTAVARRGLEGRWARAAAPTLL